MTVTESAATTDEARVDALVDDLLEKFPPKETDPRTFLGEQFDRGLAWVHFPEGHGGLGLNPKLQKNINERVFAAGGPRNGEFLYYANDWSHPPILQLDPPLDLHAGEGLRIVLTYENTTTEPIQWGLRSTDEMMIAASAQPFLTPALRLCTSAMMPRTSAISCMKNDSTNATMPSVLPGTGAPGPGAPYAGAP